MAWRQPRQYLRTFYAIGSVSNSGLPNTQHNLTVRTVHSAGHSLPLQGLCVLANVCRWVS